MEKFTQKQLKALVASGAAIDVTNAHDRNAIPENYKQIGYAGGIYGCSGKLFKGYETNRLYAITTRSQAIYIL